jgi:two-component system, cell cycle response regulator
MAKTGSKTIISQTLVGLTLSNSERRRPCIVQFSGTDLGRPYFLKDKETVLGREPRSGIRLNELKVSRRHAKISITKNGVFIEDLRSANGTFVNGAPLSDPAKLRDGDMITIGPAAFKYFAPGNVEQLFHDKLYRQATIDAKTGVFNDKYLLTTLRSEIEMSKNFRRDLSIIIYDLDHFKKVNDRFGHLFGDHVLKVTAQVVCHIVRKNDVVCRYGGEEFVVVLPETDLHLAVSLAERVRRALEQTQFPVTVSRKKHVHVQTMSLGVAQMSPGKDTLESLLKAADSKLYKAKRGGRNRVAA